MKKQFHYILFILIGFLFLSSCEDDNYAEPDSGIQGHFIDATTKELVPFPVQGSTGVKLKMFEKDRLLSQGADYSELPISFYGKIDGTYENTWMFGTTYRIAFEQTNFYPIDSIDVVLKAGKNTQLDFYVTPYCRVDIEKAEYENERINVSFNIFRDRNDYKIQSTFLVWHISPYIDNVTGNFMSVNTVNRLATPDNEILDTTLQQTINLAEDANFNNVSNRAIIKKNNNQIYVRIGVMTNNKVNYSKVIPIKISL